MTPVAFAIQEYIRLHGIKNYEVTPEIWDAIDWGNENIGSQLTPKALKLGKNIAFFYEFKCAYAPFTDANYQKKSKLFIKSQENITPINPIIAQNSSELSLAMNISCDFIAIHTHEVRLYETLTAPGNFSWLNKIRYGYLNYFLLQIKD